MKVWFFTNTLVGGGAEKQMLLTAALLAERGVVCEIVALSRAPERPRYQILIARCRNAGVRISSTDGVWSAMANVAKLGLQSLWKGRRDILWTWGYRAEALRILLPPLWRMRAVASIRSANESEIRRRGWIFFCGRVLTWRYVSNSYAAIEMVTNLAWDIRCISRVVYNALAAADTVALPRPAVTGRRILMLGNLRVRAKGLDVAVKVAEQIKDSGCGAQIVVGGYPVSGEPDLREMIRVAGVSAIMILAGGVDDARTFLKSGDVFLMLSRYEGTPNALLEAMSLGLPCVCTDVGDVRRFEAEGQCVKVVASGDADQAFVELMRLLDDPPRSRALGERARAFCQDKFTERAMLQATVEALDLAGGDSSCGLG